MPNWFEANKIKVHARFIKIDFPAFLHTSSHIAYTFPAEIAWEIHNLFTLFDTFSTMPICGFDDCNYKSILWTVQFSIISNTVRQFDVELFFQRQIEINSKKTTKVINISIKMQLVCAFISLGFVSISLGVVRRGLLLISENHTVVNYVRNRNFKWIFRWENSGLFVCMLLFNPTHLLRTETKHTHTYTPWVFVHLDYIVSETATLILLFRYLNEFPFYCATVSSVFAGYVITKASTHNTLHVYKHICRHSNARFHVQNQWRNGLDIHFIIYGMER